MGNLFSVKNKFTRLKQNVKISSNCNEILEADKLILPGVGHFSKAMENIKNMKLYDVINKSVLIKKLPILGICLGMQLMAKHSEEGNCNGFGWTNANVVKFRQGENNIFKVPHMGWNNVFPSVGSLLLKGISENEEFFFVHSYHLKTDDKSIIAGETDYIYRFCSVFEKENIFGVQFHPEKSHDAGEIILKNFINL